MKIKVYYRAIHSSGSYSDIIAKSLPEMHQELKKWAECPNGTDENKQYWLESVKQFRIERVIELSESAF